VFKKVLIFYCFFNIQPEPNYEGWIAFTGLRQPRIAIVSTCRPSTVIRVNNFKSFCELAGKELRPYRWFCVRVTGTADRCTSIQEQNTKTRKVIRWEN